MAPITSHFVLASGTSATHVTLLIGFGVALLQRFPGLALTLYLPANVSDHAESELKNQVAAEAGSAADDLKERFRLCTSGDEIISFPEAGSIAGWIIRSCTDRGCQLFPTILQSLLKSEGVTDGKGNTLTSIVAPTLIIADFFAFYVGAAIKSVAPGLALLDFHAAPAGHLVELFGTHPGTVGDIPIRSQRVFDDVLARKDRTLAEITTEALGKDPLEQIVKIPGYPDMYAYELVPQGLPFPGAEFVYQAMAQGWKDSQGSIFLSSPALEPATIPHLQLLFPQNHFVPFLPRIAPTSRLPSTTEASSPQVAESTRIMEFLESKPAHSVLYVSFGSSFHPTILGPDNFRAFVEALLDDQQPWSFVMTKGSKKAAIEEELLERIAKSGKGITVDWAPQRQILAHKSIGLMVTHAGSGGTFEAVTSSVPLIFWPIVSDQPMIAKLFSHLGVGLELIQVRTACAANDSLQHGKVYGTPEAIKAEVLDKVTRFWGEEGEVLAFRERSRELSEHLRIAKAPGGDSYNALGELEKYL